MLPCTPVIHRKKGAEVPSGSRKRHAEETSEEVAKPGKAKRPAFSCFPGSLASFVKKFDGKTGGGRRIVPMTSAANCF